MSAVLLAGCTSRTSGEATGQSIAPPPSAQEDTTPAPDLSDFEPDEDNPDPSTAIEDIELVEYDGSKHAGAGQRVAYDRQPPLGGAHDQVWAACNGVVYDRAVRTEHMVHSLEHGAVWIAYDPDALGDDEIDELAGRVEGQPYLLMSPYPGLDRPISLQSWGHQLKLDDADDERIDQFVTALRANQYTTPEPGASCDTNPDLFDQTNPPPFDPSPPGPDAMPVDGS